MRASCGGPRRSTPQKHRPRRKRFGRIAALASSRRNLHRPYAHRAASDCADLAAAMVHHLQCVLWRTNRWLLGEYRFHFYEPLPVEEFPPIARCTSMKSCASTASAGWSMKPAMPPRGISPGHDPVRRLCQPRHCQHPGCEPRLSPFSERYKTPCKSKR
jgi:hypothetical protein